MQLDGGVVFGSGVQYVTAVPDERRAEFFAVLERALEYVAGQPFALLESFASLAGSPVTVTVLLFLFFFFLFIWKR